MTTNYGHPAHCVKVSVCFQGGEASTNFGGIWNKKKEEEE